MPFHGYAPIPAADGKPLGLAAAVAGWLVREGEYVQPETKIATVQFGDSVVDLTICFPAIIEKQLVTAGSTIQPGTNILRWIADGENIPYGKAYFRTQPKA